MSVINPLTPVNDEDRISPYNINQISDENKEKYQFVDYYWSDTKFSVLTLKELYGWLWGERQIWSGSERVNFEVF